MDTEKREVDRRAEARRKRRQQERIRALLILAGIVFCVCLLLGIGIFSLTRIFSNKQNKDATALVGKQEEEIVIDNQIPVMDNDEVEENLAQEVAGEEATEEDETEAENTEEEPEEESAEAANEETESVTEDSENEEEETQEERDSMLAEQIASKISNMTLEEKIAQLFFVTPGQLMGKESVVDAVGGDFNTKLNEFPIGGVLFDDGNIRDAETLKAMISNINLMVNYPMFFGVCDEGGEDSPLIKGRVSENVIASHNEIGDSLGESGAYSAGISIGGELKMYGFNVNFAPYADYSLQKGSVAEKRGFGTDYDTTVSLTKNYVKGLEDQGMLTCAKYFPSYGDATQDGKNGQVTSQRTKEDLAKEYSLYQEAIGAGADFVMISHVGLPKVRNDRRPASLSKEVITDIVREEWGYDGVVITDYMNKSCIYNSYTYAEAAVGAIEAGADMLLSVKNFEKSYNGLLDAVKNGEITQERIDESLERIFRLKYTMNY